MALGALITVSIGNTSSAECVESFIQGGESVTLFLEPRPNSRGEVRYGRRLDADRSCSFTDGMFQISMSFRPLGGGSAVAKFWNDDPWQL